MRAEVTTDYSPVRRVILPDEAARRRVCRAESRQRDSSTSSQRKSPQDKIDRKTAPRETSAHRPEQHFTTSLRRRASEGSHTSKTSSRQIMKHQHREQAAESQHLLGKELRPHKTTRPQWTSRVICCSRSMTGFQATSRRRCRCRCVTWASAGCYGYLTVRI